MKALKILYYLQNTPHAVSIPTICANFDCCERTVRRYLVWFEAVGYCVIRKRFQVGAIRYMVES